MDSTPRRVLCATETVVTDKEDDNEEPLNVPSEASRDVSPRRPGDPPDQSLEFYKTILEEGKDFPSLAFMLSTDTKSHLPVIVVSQCELAFWHKRGGHARLHFYMNTFGNYRFVSAMR